MNFATPISSSPRLHLAEWVLPGHPDRLADAVAESLVDLAVAHDAESLVGVEVGVHRDVVFVTGRIASGRPEKPLALDLTTVVHEVCRDAGYVGRWALAPRVEADLDVGQLSDDERGIRRFSDDQSIVVGHACGTGATDHLPPAHFAVRRLAQAIHRVRCESPQVLGPDAKVLVAIEEDDAGRFRWRHLNAAVLHAPGVQYSEVHALIQPALEATARDLDACLPGLADSWRPDLPRINGAGDFSCGGPRGDNGLSGKKLVVDHYGPGVPIGGGALCGKDPHKVDRQGALRARQLALMLLRATGARSVTTRIVYVPGLDRPTAFDAIVDGRPWADAQIRRAVTVPDLTIAGTVRDLELTAVRWRERAAWGSFGGEAR